jgi:sensor histidine kinase YesM
MSIRSFAKAMLVNTAMAFVVPVVAWCFSPSITPSRLIRLFLISFVYSNSVGALFHLFFGHVWTRSITWGPIRAWTPRILATFAFGTVGTMIGTAVLYAMGLTGSFWAFFWDGYRFALLITAGASVTITLYETFKSKLEASNLQLKQKELERERAIKLATEATLSSLESRIHPHFLFNTINSISSLIHEDPAKAERLLGKLADLLRFSLDAPQLGLVPLAHEMKIVEDYLEIEKARLGGRLRYGLDWDTSLSSQRVPPLSIQTLVENSIKYAIAPRREGGSVDVRVRAVGGALEVEVQDDGPGFALSAIPSGHGIENLESRLKAMFSGHPGLSIQTLTPGCRIQFTAPQS